MTTTSTSSRAALRRNGFTFKQFFVAHDRCAMKVGTDGVLLGAWAPVEQASSILDIGSGSGLVALMLAQRSAATTMIDAVELEPAAAAQAQENILASPWAARITLHSTDIQQFNAPDEGYALIVSNPPYFASAVACRDSARETARYTQSLTHDALLACAQRLLRENGLFCVVLPYEIGMRFATNATLQGWYIAQQIDIRDRPGKPLNRILLALSRQVVAKQQHTLSLRDEQGVYSAEFCQLITDFYLFY